jgi:hypothetical protein
MYSDRKSQSVTTDSGGAATVYFDAANKVIHAIRYVADGSTPYDNTVDFTFTGETTGMNVLTIANVSASATYYPVAAANKAADGSASTLTERPVILANERLKLVLAQGGNAKVGAFHVIYA